MKCKYKYKHFVNFKCPYNTLPGSNFCKWHEPRDGKGFFEKKIQETDLIEAYLVKANLIGTIFKENTDLWYANLQGANLIGANLQGADLVRTNLQGADLQNANLQGADLRYANLQGADLQNANLQGADLRYANLQGANLSHEDLKEAKLDRADLRTTFLYGVYFKDAKSLQYAKIGNVYIEEIIADELSQILSSKESYEKSLREFLAPELRKLRLTKKDIELFISKAEIHLTEILITLRKIHKDRDTISKFRILKYKYNLYQRSLDVYINLKNYLKNAGFYDGNAVFFISEYRVRGKIFKVRGNLSTYILWERIKHTFQKLAFWKRYKEADKPLHEKKSANLLWDMLANYFAFSMNRLIYRTSSYGESVGRVILTAFLIILAYAGIYSIKGGIIVQNEAQPIHSFLTSLYFSIVTFTTLGYGDLHPVPSIGMRLLAGSEAFLGAFLLAYFVVVVSRKIMR